VNKYEKGKNTKMFGCTDKKAYHFPLMMNRAFVFKKNPVVGSTRVGGAHMKRKKPKKNVIFNLCGFTQ